MCGSRRLFQYLLRYQYDPTALAARGVQAILQLTAVPDIQYKEMIACMAYTGSAARQP